MSCISGVRWLLFVLWAKATGIANPLGNPASVPPIFSSKHLCVRISSLFRSTRCHAKDRRIAIHTDGANKSDTLSTSTEYEGEHSPARIHHGIHRQTMLVSYRPRFRIAQRTQTRRDVDVVYRISLKHQVFDRARQFPSPRYYIRHEDTFSSWNVIGYLRNRWSGV